MYYYSCVASGDAYIYILIIDEIHVWIIKKINAYNKTKTQVLKCERRVFQRMGMNIKIN